MRFSPWSPIRGDLALDSQACVDSRKRKPTEQSSHHVDTLVRGVSR